MAPMPIDCDLDCSLGENAASLYYLSNSEVWLGLTGFNLFMSVTRLIRSSFVAVAAVLIVGSGTSLFAKKSFTDSHSILPASATYPIQEFTQVSRYRVGVVADETDPASAAKEYLLEHADLYGGQDIVRNLEFIEVVNTKVSVHVRFRQLWQGIPVYASFYNVSMNFDNEITMVTASYVRDINVAMQQRPISGEEAKDLVHREIGGGMLDDNETPVELMVFRDEEEHDHLVQVVHYPSSNPHGDWEVLVDAETTAFLKLRNTNFYLDATGKVFLPDPLSTAEAEYGDPGFIDNDDVDSEELNNQRVTITLRDVTHDIVGYHLSGPYVQITDFDAPFIPPTIVQSDTGFCFTRSQNGFEEVNAYYHIDAMQRYLQTLGLENLQSGPIEVDAHGANGADLSYYSPSLNAIAFGDGGVDDAEDADVIIHEYGHALHCAAVGDLISNDMRSVSEGIGDFLAGSYSARHSAFHQDSVFNWDGFNPFFEGRTLTSNGVYPDHWTPWDYYNNGSIWANALWRMHNRMEPDSVDAIVLHSIYYHGPNSSVADAAEAILQAELDLFDGRYRTIVYESLVEKGFLQPTIIIEPEEIVVSLERNTILDTCIVIQNHGGQLDWVGNILPRDEDPIEPMTLYSEFAVGLNGNRELFSSVTIMDDGYYLTVLDVEENVFLYHYNAEGIVSSSIQINDVTTTPFGELTNDGENLYGITGNRIYGFSTQGQPLETIPVNREVKDILSFEPERNLFWLVENDSTLFACDRFGLPQDTIQLDMGIITSIAYYNFEDRIPSLLVSTQEENQQVVYVVGLEDGNNLGRYILPDISGEWNGADCGVYFEALPNYMIYVSIMESEEDSFYLKTLLMDWNVHYVDIDPLSGVIPVNSNDTIPVRLSAHGLEGGLYEADILFYFEELDETLSVPLKIHVVMVDAEEPKQPENFKVSNAYPNPFNSSVKVEMVLPFTQDVNIEVFNILGQRVYRKNLPSMTQGYHQFTWHAENHLASGMYLLQIKTENHHTHLQKILLVR